MTLIQAAFFDLDGTLIDSLPDITAAANAAVAPLNVGPFTQQEVRPHVGQGAARLLANLLDIRVPTSPTLMMATERFMAYYETHVASRTRVYPGIAELLLHFAPIPKVVISNKSTHLAVAALQSVGLAEQFVAIYGGDAFELKKPDPYPLHKAAELVNTALSSVLMVGDSIYDIRAGKAAGTHTCGVSWGLGSVESIQAEGADVIAHHPSDLIEWYSPQP